MRKRKQLVSTDGGDGSLCNRFCGSSKNTNAIYNARYNSSEYVPEVIENTVAI